MICLVMDRPVPTSSLQVLHFHFALSLEVYCSQSCHKLRLLTVSLQLPMLKDCLGEISRSSERTKGRSFGHNHLTPAALVHRGFHQPSVCCTLDLRIETFLTAGSMQWCSYDLVCAATTVAGDVTSSAIRRSRSDASNASTAWQSTSSTRTEG